ncbi:hypothetical protein QCN29_27710 [Streptomyces sp. HNM0663]|uniref:Uncharacterized protein n=1 Tax=Streptomyces chengmaiensis TaxID=3040919 RepID=A0ABT6HUV5_9ACTN|nr:hypothetical protein [Streptomyces chengmaiensis]MDH2392497.1 hypothetical protein [Streptomyces chengmaiensis]
MNQPSADRTADTADAPIYSSLIRELGDIPAQVRRTAEQTMEEVDRAVDFSSAGGSLA